MKIIIVILATLYIQCRAGCGVHTDNTYCMQDCLCSWCEVDGINSTSFCMGNDIDSVCFIAKGTIHPSSDSDYCKRQDLNLILGMTLSFGPIVLVLVILTSITLFVPEEKQRKMWRFICCKRCQPPTTEEG